MTDRLKGKVARVTRRVVFALSLTVAGSIDAHAILPASAEQMLCLSSYIFAGRVVAVTTEPYKKPDRIASTLPGRRVDLSVAVRDVLGVASSVSANAAGPVLAPGDTFKVFTWLSTTLDFGGDFDFDVGSAIQFRAPSPWLSEERVAPALMGKDFIFAARKASPGTGYEVQMWRIDKKDWILKTMEQARRQTTPQASFGGTDCPSTSARSQEGR